MSSLLWKAVKVQSAYYQGLPSMWQNLLHSCFYKKHYKHEVYLNFFMNPDCISIFEGSLEVDNSIITMSALLGPNAIFEDGKITESQL